MDTEDYRSPRRSTEDTEVSFLIFTEDNTEVYKS
jgi:hypothetical protein